MTPKTRKKVEFLQKYVRKEYKNWFKIHDSNIVGFRVDKKVSNGKSSRYYSIIFHVKRKRAKGKLQEQEIIPPFLSIKFPDGKRRKIKTDVEETGKPQLHLGECRKPKNNGNVEVGTIGVVLKDDTDLFAVTNFHVAGINLMQAGTFDFEGEDNNIFVDGQRSTFVEGIFSDEIDVAFIRLGNVINNPNQMGDGTQIAGFMEGPLRPSLMGKEVTVYSKNMRKGKTATINNNSAIFNTGFQDLFITDVLQISPKITQRGDSGGAVLISEDVLIGIVIGADNSFTYAIPYFKVNNFKPLTIA